MAVEHDQPRHRSGIEGIFRNVVVTPQPFDTQLRQQGFANRRDPRTAEIANEAGGALGRGRWSVASVLGARSPDALASVRRMPKPEAGVELET